MEWKELAPHLGHVSNFRRMNVVGSNHSNYFRSNGIRTILTPPSRLGAQSGQRDFPRANPDALIHLGPGKVYFT